MAALSEAVRRRQRDNVAARHTGGPPGVGTMIIDGIEASGDAAAGIPITMLAYGDSWFDYPVHDLLRAFNDAMDDAPAILTRARAGNELVKDITSKRALNEIKLDLKSYGAAEALLISGGGNDFSGEDGRHLKNLLRADCSNAGGAADCFDDAAVVRRMGALMDGYRKLLGLAAAHSPGLPVIAHTYDYACTSGKGLLWLGPWLRPALVACKVPERLYDGVINRLIDRFKCELEQLRTEHDALYVIDLTYTLDKRDWANELHPTPAGFARLGKRYAEQYRKAVAR
jgi:lysophospholipase L1-like esterase